MNDSRDGGEASSCSKAFRVVLKSSVYCDVSADFDSPVVRQPSNANEKTQLISDGSRRYADTYT